MGCEKRPYLCGILILGILALFFHIVGFVTPGWLVLRRSVLEKESLFSIKGQLIDNGGVTPPPEVEDEQPILRKRSANDDSDSSLHDDDWHHRGGEHPHHPPHHHSHHGGHGPYPGPHPEPHRPTPSPKPTGESEEVAGDIREEHQTMEAWMMETTSEIDTFDVRTSFGLWYSTLCVHMKREFADSKDESDDSSSEEDNERKGHCRCKKVSTKCALYYASISSMYENSFPYQTKTGGPLSYRNFGYASLVEHRVENCFVLALLVLGLISAIAGFRKDKECRYARFACVIFMMLAAFIALVPVARLGHYSIVKTNQSNSVHVHAPYSVIATGLGALFALVTALVAGCGVMAKSRRGQLSGKSGWYQFNNEMETPNEKKEKSGFYVTADALPVKSGLYDVCDFSDVKPLEELRNQ